MKKTTFTKLLIAVLLVLTAFSFIGASFASDQTIPSPTPFKDQKLIALTQKVIGVVQFVGIAIAVIMLIVYGIKYFTSDAENQAKLQKAAAGYFIGAVCIFGAVSILEFFKTSLKNFVS